ncbi:phosphoribosylamine--glycine ligase [Methylophilaceae bacterium]|nr:phosphoribosylamine--glycine ligase [Methylophilaceae bacterium]
MKVLVIGSGGREHAMAWKLSHSKKINAIFIAPGNGGTHLNPKFNNIDLTDINLLSDFAIKEKLTSLLLVQSCHFPKALLIYSDLKI